VNSKVIGSSPISDPVYVFDIIDLFNMYFFFLYPLDNIYLFFNNLYITFLYCISYFHFIDFFINNMYVEIQNVYYRDIYLNYINGTLCAGDFFNFLKDIFIFWCFFYHYSFIFQFYIFMKGYLFLIWPILLLNFIALISESILYYFMYVFGKKHIDIKYTDYKNISIKRIDYVNLNIKIINSKQVYLYNKNIDNQFKSISTDIDIFLINRYNFNLSYNMYLNTQYKLDSYNLLYKSYCVLLEKILNNNNTYLFYITKYKMNFRYSISIMLYKNLILSYSLRNFFNKKFNIIGKKLRYSTLNFFLLKIINNFYKFYNINIYFIFNNLNFIGISYLDNFFKNIDKIGLIYILILFNINYNYKTDKYYKKIKTIKKFKKKIYNYLSKVNFKSVYFI